MGHDEAMGISLGELQRRFEALPNVRKIEAARIGGPAVEASIHFIAPGGVAAVVRARGTLAGALLDAVERCEAVAR